MLHELCFIITPRKVQPILGKDVCEKLNMIKRVNIIQNLDQNNALSAYKELFTRIGYLPGRVSIKLKPRAEYLLLRHVEKSHSPCLN